MLAKINSLHPMPRCALLVLLGAFAVMVGIATLGASLALVIYVGKVTAGFFGLGHGGEAIFIIAYYGAVVGSIAGAVYCRSSI